MEHPQTPRILAPHLQSFQHKIVRMLGKVVQLRGETAVIDAGGNVDVILNRVRINPSLPTYFLSFLFSKLLGPCDVEWGGEGCQEMWIYGLTRVICTGLPSNCRQRGRNHRKS
jgi:hypothetical protein